MSKTMLNITPLALIITLCVNPCTYANELRIPIGQQAQDMTHIDMPTKGMSKEKVKSLFGHPIEEVPAKGTPPISRWKYQEFTVYFDNDAVIHSVRNFQSKTKSSESSEPSS